MSSSKSSFVRKRRSDDESSDLESDEDSPRVKRPRKWKLASYFVTKCEGLLQWVHGMPMSFGNFFKDSMLHRSLVQNSPDTIVIDETNEDVEPEIIEIQDDDPDPTDLKKFIQASMKADAVQLPRTRPFSSSTPYYRDIQLRSSSNGLPQKSTNGYHNPSNRKCQHYCQSKTRSHRVGSIEHQSAPLTNPGTEIEILLDTRQPLIDPIETPTDDPEELEIVSEIKKRPNKHSLRSTSSMYRNTQNSDSLGMSSFDALSNGKTSTPYRKEKSSQKYTALEVVRLQEKDQYRLLLEKMVNKTFYQPMIKKDSQPIEIQVDSTDEDEPVIAKPFKKEFLHQPVDDFLKKYYKPFQPAPPVAPPSPNTLEKLHETGQGIDDDDVQVVEVSPEHKPKSKRTPDFFSSEWINELKNSINAETETRLQIVKEQEEKIERFKKRRDAKNVEEKQIRDHLKLSGVVLDSSFEEENEFPEMSSEMESEVDIALAPIRDGGELLSELPEKKVQVRRADLYTLHSLNWLNDEIINFYLALISERSNNNTCYPRVYTYNSFFYSSLKTRGPQRVLRWTKNVDVFSYDILIVPLHLGVHWALCVIDNRSKRIKYYDSMRSSEDVCLKLLQSYVATEMKDKKNIIIDPNTYSLEVVKDIPQQMNGSDCGMFALKYAEYISRDAPITFTQNNMPYFRRKMVYEIIHKQLL